jgi:undecaprenyl diphosphate synthase
MAEPAGRGAVGMPARYVAIIMDGNGRWAQQRGVDVNEGHREGARALRRTVENAVDLGIRELTAYAFSTENWTRPGSEVEAIMELFGEMIQTQTPDLDEEGVRMRFIGRREGVSPELLQQMDWSEAVTRTNERMTLYVAFNYGGRAEILDAAERYGGGGEEEFARHLYAPHMTDPDLLIRTSGERRLSNFLLWQCAYSELVFSDALWPDFDRPELEAALDEFEQRQRRFGAR